MRLEFFEDAAAEIEEDRGWYLKRSESAETGFLRELDHAIRQVIDAPGQWPPYLAGTRRYVFPTYPDFNFELQLWRGADGTAE